MLKSSSNFFFGAFDPAGFVTVDKPPVALWIQAISAKLFGYRGISLLLPEAVMGVASVLLTYHLVRRVVGAGAGLVAGLMLAITPICVAVDRDNLPDSALVFVLLLAAWALSRASETGRPGLLLLATALVGVGFNIKMLAAFVVLPTFYLCYLVAAPFGWRTKLGHLAVATLILAAVSLSWSIAVELTPKDRRPYIGGSRNNSALDLALGYNGIGRVLGGRGNLGPPGSRRFPGARALPKAEVSADTPRPKLGSNASPPRIPGDPEAFPPGAPGMGFPPGGPGGGFPPMRPGGPFAGGRPPMFGGMPGIMRFARPLIAGQITWLFPLAIIGTVVAAVHGERRWPIGPRQLTLLFWAGWLGTHWVVFSFAGDLSRILHDDHGTTRRGPGRDRRIGVV